MKLSDKQTLPIKPAYITTSQMLVSRNRVGSPSPWGETARIKELLTLLEHVKAHYLSSCLSLLARLLQYKCSLSYIRWFDERIEIYYLPALILCIKSNPNVEKPWLIVTWVINNYRSWIGKCLISIRIIICSQSLLFCWVGNIPFPGDWFVWMSFIPSSC
jgi:hypothetical protein